MQKLHHLLADFDLARDLLSRWPFDPATLELLPHFRISANAVYPFRAGREDYYLRCAPTDEKRPDDVRAEIRFLDCLRAEGYPAVRPVPSRTGDSVVEHRTASGAQVAVVFAAVPGTTLDRLDYDDAMARRHGKALGWLHRLSSRCDAAGSGRRNEKDVLVWVRDTLGGDPSEAAALREAGLLEAWFESLPADRATYGLVHYDFERDNLLYDATTGTLGVIDFDDCMRHWFVADIEQALDDAVEDAREEDRPRLEAAFLEGYRTEFGVSDAMLRLRPGFRRFCDLYGYARIRWSLDSEVSDPPDWMAGLKAHLEDLLVRRSRRFGDPLPDPRT